MAAVRFGSVRFAPEPVPVHPVRFASDPVRAGSSLLAHHAPPRFPFGRFGSSGWFGRFRFGTVPVRRFRSGSRPSCGLPLAMARRRPDPPPLGPRCFFVGRALVSGACTRPPTGKRGGVRCPAQQTGRPAGALGRCPALRGTSAGWHLGVSDCNPNCKAHYGVHLADLHEMEFAIRGVNTDNRSGLTSRARATPTDGTLQLRRRARRRD